MIEKDGFDEEFSEIVKWSIKEEDRVMDELKRNGKYQEGLDANSEYWKPIYVEAKRRVQELRKKYGTI